MAGLKELRNRLESIKSTQKITSAMKLVAASRLRRAETLLERNKPYSETLATAIKRTNAAIRAEEAEKKIIYMPPALLRQKPNAQKYLLLVFSSDRGLCGSYNHNVAKTAAARIRELMAAGKDVNVVCYGKKAFNILKKQYADIITENFAGAGAQDLSYTEALEVKGKITSLMQENDYDVCEIVYSRFYSALSREIKARQIYPIASEIAEPTAEEDQNLLRVGNAYYDYYPDKISLLEKLLALWAENSIFAAVLNAQASEQGARMASMDNATRNAKDIISNLTLKYNSIRQSAITTELTEIISGAEAL